MVTNALLTLVRNRRACSPTVLLLALLALCLTDALFAATLSDSQGTFSNSTLERKAVTVLTGREGDVTHFYVDNQEFCEVTMTFEIGLQNLKGNTPFPFTATFPPRGK